MMMKGEYQEEEDDGHEQHNDISNSTPQSTPSTHLFPNFQSHPKFLSTPPHFLPPHHPYPHHPQQQFQTTEITPPKPSKKPKTTSTPTTSSEDGTGGGGGGTIELSHSRRPRGRPPGSKNRPKPAIIITREPDPSTSMSPYILELPSGSDLVDSLTRFTRRRSVGLCVLTATGVVENVMLKQPSNSVQGGTLTFHGRFDVLSLQACLLVESSKTMSFGSNCGMGVFTISLAGPQGQIVGGKVVGPLVCCGTVYVVATSFNNPSYCRLPLDSDGDRVTVTAGDGDCEGDGDGSGTQVSLYSGGGGGHEVVWGPAVSGSGGGGGGGSRPQSQQHPRY